MWGHMSHPDTMNIRISSATNAELKELAAKVRQFSAGGLADALLHECCVAAMGGEGEAKIPTLDYIRQTLRKQK